MEDDGATAKPDIIRQETNKTVIQVSVFYPYHEGCTFNLEYYLNSHIPMVKEKLGPSLKGVTVVEGLGGGAPGSSPAYVVFGHLLFESLEEFQKAIAPHNEAFLADIVNYTDISPFIQISEIKFSQ